MSWLRIVPFCCLPFYWAWLALNTQPLIIYDAIGYEAAGRLIAAQGLGAYFHELGREPLFPYLVSRAMLLEQAWGPHYQYFLKPILLVFLALTLTGIYRLARLLGARRSWAGAGVFYAGVSPIILNSTLWLWSEAAALPWAVWGVFFCLKAWRAAGDKRDPLRAAGLAFMAGVMFTGLLMVKAAVSVVVMIYGLPFLLAGVVFLFRRDRGRATAFIAAGSVFLVIFLAAVEGYKALNYRMNGNYAITSRYHWALYGNTARRLMPLTKERIAQAVLSVPRLGLCEKVYGRECGFWTYQMSDNISNEATAYCNSQGFSEEQQRQFLLNNSFQLMARHPFQQAAMSVVEGTKMLFWENRNYFVRYPAWLAGLYSQSILVCILCFGWAALSLAALVYAFIRWSAGSLLTASFVLWFIAVHAIFFIDMRYALPIAPLFIVLTVVMLQAGFRKISAARSRKAAVDK
ncbi:MAG: hypothetical protein HQL20_04015 [Candidatus Omnitrophica bacterium]|nr:hypothetical protein [Candidatus Omnitrophota bacterium]